MSFLNDFGQALQKTVDVFMSTRKILYLFVHKCMIWYSIWFFQFSHVEYAIKLFNSVRPTGFCDPNETVLLVGKGG